jgi:hypothetical protein
MCSRFTLALFACVCMLLSGCNKKSVVSHAEDFHIAGTLSGLTPGAQLTVSDNGQDSVTLTANGPFSFDAPVNYNGSYMVAVVTQPVGETCTISNYSGTGVAGNVVNVNVTCSVDTYPIGGMISGLAASTQVILEYNGGDVLTISANGPFTFATAVSYQGSYNVTVGTQPTGQTCTVTDGAGTSVVAPVTGISVLCATDTFTIGGNITGLASGDQVTLDNNGADPLTVTANGQFTFSGPVAYNGTYNVTVGTQPPGQTCTVTNGSGIATAMNITNIGIACSTDTYTISGHVTGLAAGTQLVMDNNGGDPLTLTANGTFTFATPVSNGGSFDVTVGTEPVGQTCTVNGGMGTTVTNNVSTVNVLCAVDTYTIGGTITGLTASGLVLKDNGGNALAVAAGSTTFQFATPVVYEGGYNVTVFQEPLGQSCTVGNASTSAVTANVKNVTVICTNTYTVGGTVSGLSGSVTLLDNGGNALALSTSGSFTFTTPIAQGSAYALTVGTQPSTQTCTVANGSGTATSNVTNVTVTCTTNTYMVGGTVSGLSGSVTLLDNSGNALSLSTSGPFTFAASVAQGSTYAVTVGTQPLNQTCTVANGSGTMGNAIVTDVGVNCATNVPTATAISPSSGPIAGGTVVTVTGTSFVAGNTTVTIGGTAIAAMVSSPTSLTFTTSPHAPGNVAVSVTTPGVTSGNIPGGFTFEGLPTVSCSANPSTVNPGDSSTITAVGTSPANLPLTYSYSATAGSISGNSATATLSTAGAAPGTITVTCNVVDSHGNPATAGTTVTVVPPPPPPP